MLTLHALTQINLTKAVAISFTIPIFTSLLAMLFLKERVQNRKILALIGGFIGMLIIVKPGYDYEAGILYAIVGAFLWSVTNIFIKILGRNCNVIVKTFYFTALSALLTLPLIKDLKIVYDLNHIVWLVSIAIVLIVDLIAISNSFQKADLTLVMPFTFLQLLFAAIVWYFVFGETLSMATFIGSAIIIISTVYVGHLGKRAAKMDCR